ncbi:MAG: hypothetical protein LBI90_04840 [Treponema sp.]|nr:hypothetical protein [Treponema sp.]
MIIRAWKKGRFVSLPAGVLAVVLARSIPGRLHAEQSFLLRFFPGFYAPLDNSNLTPGFTGTAGIDWRFLPFMGASLQGGYLNAPIIGGGSAQVLDVHLGPVFFWRPLSRFSLEADAGGGLYSASRNESSISGISFGGRLAAVYHITPALSAGIYGAYRQYAYTPEPFINSVSAGLGISLNLTEAFSRETRIRADTLNRQFVFPVSYSWYNENPFATVKITNNEKVDITRIRTSFYLERYMSQPKLCGVTSSLKPGESVEIPISAFFNESVMSLTESIVANAKIIVEYRALGQNKQADIPMELPIFHRNAMSWDDDRRASSFVSARDPSVQWFSRYVSSMVQNRQRPQIQRNIQVALGMFESLNIYGINYIIDPSSSYIELSGNSSSLDSLNYPYQTLMYRGGDCDDLAILFSSLMESAGIETAFLTIPGHIYMAFDLGLTEEEARKSFYAPEELIFHGGKVWVPLEITIPKEGFYRAWRIGAKEWRDADRRGAAAIYPMHASWEIYPPVSVPGAASRIALPSENTVAEAFDRSINAWVSAQIRPQVQSYEEQLARREDPEIRNRLGVLYGSYGMLGKAQEQFAIAARNGNEDGWLNLGNAAFLEQRYRDSIWYSQRVLQDDPENPVAMLALARSYYEENNFSSSDRWYAEIQIRDPALARDYAYLGSFFENRGRGFSLSDRLTTAPWALGGNSYAGLRTRTLEALSAEPAPRIGGLASTLSFTGARTDEMSFEMISAPSLAVQIESGSLTESRLPVPVETALLEPEEIIAAAAAERDAGQAEASRQPQALLSEPLTLVLPQFAAGDTGTGTVVPAERPKPEEIEPGPKPEALEPKPITVAEEDKTDSDPPAASPGPEPAPAAQQPVIVAETPQPVAEPDALPLQDIFLRRDTVLAEAKPEIEKATVPALAETPQPAVEAPIPAAQQPSALAETPQPAVETPVPAVQRPAIVVETPQSAVETSAPIAQQPSALAETPQPTVEAPVHILPASAAEAPAALPPETTVSAIEQKAEIPAAEQKSETLPQEVTPLQEAPLSLESPGSLTERPPMRKRLPRAFIAGIGALCAAALLAIAGLKRRKK